MAQKETIILIVLLCCLAVHSTTPGSATAQGGNITPINLTQTRETTVWQGLVGNLIIAGPNQTNITAIGGEINQTDIVIASTCASPTITGTILFSNSSATPTLLTAGNLSQLDLFLNFPTETGTETFPNTSTFTIGGIPITNVPTTNTYVNSQAQAIVFREGYLNDASGNIVFAVAINLNTIGYNGTIYDYQAILALSDNMTTPYYITTDLTVTCPSGGSKGGGGNWARFYTNASYLGAISERLPEIQTPELPPTITKEQITIIDSLKPLRLNAPAEITAIIGQNLETQITLMNPNTLTAPLVTAVLRIPSVIDELRPLHTNPLLYSFFGILPLHGSTHTATFPPIKPRFNEIPPQKTLDITLANDIPITHPQTTIGTIEVYAGTRLVATAQVTVHLTAPPFALQTEYEGNQALIMLLLNNEKQPARTSQVELDYNAGRSTPFVELYTLPLRANTVELYGYTYKHAFAYDTITATSNLGRKEAH